MSIMDGQNSDPEPGKVEPDAEELKMLRRIFRRLGVALSGLSDPEIEGLVSHLEMQANGMKLMRGRRG